LEVIPFLKKYRASTLTKIEKRIHKPPFFKHRGTSDVTVPRQPSHLGSSTVPRCTSRRSPRRRSVHVAPWHKRFRGLGVADLYWFDIWHVQHDSSAYVMMCTRLWCFFGCDVTCKYDVIMMWQDRDRIWFCWLCGTSQMLLWQCNVTQDHFDHVLSATHSNHSSSTWIHSNWKAMP